MKDRHREWEKLSYPRKAQPKPPPIRMLDLRGMRDLENKLVLYSDRRGELTHQCEDWCDELCLEIFGITTADTEFAFPADYHDLHDDDPALWAIHRNYDRHEARFQTRLLDAKGQAEFLTRLGLDFTDARGDPLRCLKRFARPAEAAAKQIGSLGARMPERSQVAVQTFEDTLEKDAQAFMASKRKRAAT